MQLSQREMMIIKWLVLIVGIYLIWSFGLVPLDNTIQARQNELNTLQNQQLITEATIPQYDSIVAEQALVKTSLEAQFSHFFDGSTQSEMEAYLVPILKQYNAQFDYFEAGPTMVVVPQTTLSDKALLTYKIKTLIDAYNQVITPPSDLPITESDLLRTQVTYILSMSLNNYLDLVSAIENMHNSIILSRSSYSTVDRMAEITLDIYTMEKLDLSE